MPVCFSIAQFFPHVSWINACFTSIKHKLDIFTLIETDTRFIAVLYTFDMDSYSSSSDNSDNDSAEHRTLDYSRLGLSIDCLEENLSHLHKISKLTDIEIVLLNHNLIATLPAHTLTRFNNLHLLDLSSNGLTQLPQDLLQICPLTKLILKNNLLTNSSLPKCLKSDKHNGLRELNLSGNLLTHFPDAVLELNNLKYLYLGANKITSVSKDIWRLQRWVFAYRYRFYVFYMSSRLVLCRKVLFPLPCDFNHNVEVSRLAHILFSIDVIFCNRISKTNFCF